MQHDARKDLLRKVTNAVHARGMIIREVPYAVFKLAVTKSQEQLEEDLEEPQSETARKRLAYALQVKKVLFEAAGEIERGRWELGQLDQRFVRMFTGGTDPNDPVPALMRLNSVLVMAFRLNKKGHAYELAGLASYGPAVVYREDGVDHVYKRADDRNVRHPVHELVNNDRIVEIDLVLSNPVRICRKKYHRSDVGGYGSLLLAYVLARAALRKKKREYMYKGALLEAAGNGIVRIAERMGFERVVRMHGEEVSLENVYVTTSGTWVQQIHDAIPDIELCPLRSGSGKTFCQ